MAAARTVFIDTTLSNYASLAEQYATDLFNVVLLDQATSAAEQIQNWLNSNDASSADINVVSGSNGLTGLFTPRVVFIDPAVANLATIIAGIPGNVTVVVLDASRDGVQQIYDFLSANSGLIEAVDIISGLAGVDVISHGSPGEVMLGSTVLSAANLADYSTQLAAIGSHLTSGADVLLYGCDVASGTIGQEFIAALAAATGADVAASTDLTGGAAAGGDWELEASTGTIDTAALSISAYEDVLTVASINSVALSADTGVSSTDFITSVAQQTITGTFTLTNKARPTIWVSVDGGITKTEVEITHTPGTSSGSFSVANVTLVSGANTSIQFWSGRNGDLFVTAQVYSLHSTPTTAISALAFSNDSGSSATDFITNAATQTISGTLSAVTTTGQVVRVSVDNGGSWQTASNMVGQNTFSLSGVNLGGSNTLKVRVEDAAGNAGPVLSQAFVLDNLAPTPGALSLGGLIDSGATGDGTTNDRTFDLSLAGNEAASTVIYEVSFNGGAFGSTAALQTDLADGSYQFRARVTDVAGNTATTNTVSVQIDATAPSAPTITGFSDNSGSALDTITADQTPTLTITAEADVTIEVFKDGISVGIATQTAPHSGVYTFMSPTLADGSHSFTTMATDAAGNSGSASLAQNVIVDTTLSAPTVALTTDSGDAGDGLTNDAALTLNTADGDATRVIMVNGAVVNGYDASSLDDGENTVSVVDTDRAGNTRSASLTFTLDTTLTAPTVALATDSGNGGDGLTNNGELILNTADSDATRVITVDGDVVSSYDADSLADGEHTVSVFDTDGAGNTKNTSVSFTLDTTLTAPTVALATDSGNGGDGLTNNGELALNTVDSDATRVITVDGAVVDSYDAGSLEDGEHTVSVVDTDGAGNTKNASVTFWLDTALNAPTVALTTDSGAAGDGLTNLAGLIFNEADSDATRVITVDGAVVDSYDAGSLEDGQHTVSVVDTDGAGNTRNASVTFTLDTALNAPTVALTTDSGAAGDGLTNLASLIFIEADSDATRVITVDGNAVSSYDASSLADGEHTVSVVDTDQAGNSKSASLVFTLDSEGPIITSGPSARVAENIGENQIVYQVQATDVHAIAYELDGADASKFEISSAGVVTLKANPNFESANAYSFSVIATDAAGNRTDQAISLAIDNVNEAPVAATVNRSTIENTSVTIQVADFVYDQDAGDKLALSMSSYTATLSWANSDPNAAMQLINPVTRVPVALSSLTVLARVSADGASLTLVPPAELDWLVTGQGVKATFNYTVTDAGGLASSDAISLLMSGSTNDRGVNLNGGNGNDILSGNATNNAEDVLQGANGNDTLSGHGGTDALYGGNGDDNLSGGAGIDYLYGDSGNDTLNGGAEADFIFGGKGNDLLTGGTGADKFVFDPQNGNDRIEDFKIAEGDKLFFADFFSTPMSVEAFLDKYVTDTGNDLLINLPGTSIVLVGVPDINMLIGAITLGTPT